MLVSKDLKLSDIDIWEPRHHDGVILIAPWKVHQHNRITFSKTPNMPDQYYLSEATIKKYPLELVGKHKMYAVHMDELEGIDYE